MNTQALIDTARMLAAGDKRLRWMKTIQTCNTGFTSPGISQTEEIRRV
jgi:hypothetical protein